MNVRHRSVDWRRYAEVYDLMAANNPAYQDLIQVFRDVVSTWRFAPNSLLADLGAGTGNFSVELARSFPECQIVHLDSNAEMNQVAAAKAAAGRVENIRFIAADIWQAPFETGSLAAATTVHALYAFPQPQAMLEKMSEWLQPGGALFACDSGRVMRVSDWAFYLFRESYRRQGLWRTLLLFRRGRSVSRQNRLVAKGQRAGRYWLHGHAEFKNAIQSAGFHIVSSSVTYRGCSDVVVGRKPP